MDNKKVAILVAKLPQEHCCLKHYPDSNPEDFPAVNYLTIPLGDTLTGQATGDKLQLPICQECEDGLADDEWTLLFCLDCCASQWVLRPVSRMQYRHHVVWSKGCPSCTGEKARGVYFSDPIND